MANNLTLGAFVYPGCIIVCNRGAKAVCGEYPEIARIYSDRSVSWSRKRISDQMREYVDSIVRTPFIAISYTQQQNFFKVAPNE